MRRVVALSASLLLAGCAQGDEDGGNAVPVVDAQPEVVTIDSTLVDSPAETSTDAAADVDDTSIVDSAGETTSDVAVDTDAADVADTADTAPVDTGTPDTGIDTGPVVPWKHTIAIDGTNDFTAAQEKFQTTSVGYDAYVTWDDSYIYVGYAGADVGSTASASKWLFAYIDVDPGMATGRPSAERYNTQQPTFPTGFGAEYYVRWRTDNADAAIKKWDGSSWAFETTAVTRAKLAAYVELRIPRSTLGSSTKFGIVTFMLNETGGGEWTYAGLYSDNFVDSYSAAKPITKYLRIDTTSGLPPNSPSNMIKP